MTNLLTVVAELFSNTLIFLLQKCEKLLQCKSYSQIFSKKLLLTIVAELFSNTLIFLLHFFSAKNIKVCGQEISR